MHLRYIISIRMERDRLQKELSWDKLRKRLKTAKLKPEHQCGKCIWADTRSGYVFCTRYQCVKENNNEEIWSG